MILQPIDNTARVENMGARQSTDLFAQTISDEHRDNRTRNVFRQIPTNKRRKLPSSKHKKINDRVMNELTVPCKCSILDCFRPRDPLERPKLWEADEWLEPRRRVFVAWSTLEEEKQPQPALAERRMETEAAVVVVVVAAAVVAIEDFQLVSPAQ